MFSFISFFLLIYDIPIFHITKTYINVYIRFFTTLLTNLCSLLLNNSISLIIIQSLSVGTESASLVKFNCFIAEIWSSVEFHLQRQFKAAGPWIIWELCLLSVYHLHNGEISFRQSKPGFCGNIVTLCSRLTALNVDFLSFLYPRQSKI